MRKFLMLRLSHVFPVAMIILMGFSITLVFSACSDDAPSPVTPGLVVRLTGTVVSQELLETPEGICQSSAFYVLVTDSGEKYALNNSRDPIYERDDFTSFERMKSELEKLAGHRVTVEGQLQTLPLSGDNIICTWIRVTSITVEK